jgi:glycosyltransferase involved in cell wall biosynthesis
MPARLSAVIPTKNVAGIVRPTLESLRFCDEVVIVDMFSTDDTRAVCESYPNVKFYQRQDYIYGNFNYGAEQAKGDWILRLDSDEVVDPELRDSILEVLNDPNPKFLHYDAFCHLYFFGMRLRHGFGDQWRTMIFRKGTARYKVRSEHEGLTTTGPAGKLRGHYDHFTNPTITIWLAKANYYLDKDVQRAPLQPPLPWWKVLLNMARYFRGAYFGKGQLRKDGYLGFVVALCSAFAMALEQLKLWEKYERARLKAAGLLPDHPNAHEPA